ncbi:hypothetical protein Pa4123_04880 [Phytohabitans aurantiacus]|uniref:Uncharacterized protein n=1 Tax=Phytohabitans aurantiacus TaxID=3016789 RepID=A0ABQ5QKP3_9ACTN|nr:hypothetical protein Pa4123_04880 [Phytohabitans aurantiacus]
MIDTKAPLARSPTHTSEPQGCDKLPQAAPQRYEIAAQHPNLPVDEPWDNLWTVTQQVCAALCTACE